MEYKRCLWIAGLALLSSMPLSQALSAERDEVILYLNDPVGSAVAAIDEMEIFVGKRDTHPMEKRQRGKILFNVLVVVLSQKNVVLQVIRRTLIPT